MPDETKLRIDIVSDVVCPWCIIGYRQLQQAIDDTGIAADIYWHPFELNPAMAPEGQDLRQHLAEKYGSTTADSVKARAGITSLGQQLGFNFQWQEDHRIYNTYGAHQLLHWASQTGRAHDLKMALFTAYFTDGLDVSDAEVLCRLAESIGLDSVQAAAVLQDGRFGDAVRDKEKFWNERGITGVPAVVFQSKHLVTGAQGSENFAEILKRLTAAAAE